MEANSFDDLEREVFERALERETAEDRVNFVRARCAEDRTLLDRVMALLEAHEDATRYLPGSLSTHGGVTPDHHDVKAGDRVGRYKLLQEIGEGGCGVVYMAEQEEPVRRRVALKIIKPGMDSKSVIARFEAERQALAMMDHPNIARVFDAGTTHSGRPFFVMELVRGESITEFCDIHQMSPRQRIELFLPVCQAVQYAHQKGIIHRDLKPSNVLVVMHDDVPVPKVIDFGLAKATEGRLTERTLFTALDQFLGTPAYMSPEQAGLSGLDIDTRSDIYSLGVLLYELLAGRPPFDPGELRQAGFDEMRRRICEVEPPKPSTRISTLEGESLRRTAATRQIDPLSLIHTLRGDLDVIVMKCLEKNRTRRYETVGSMAGDLQRHLNHEPVIARPPTPAYRLRKAILRHRLAFGVTTSLAIILLATSSISLVLAKRARNAERSEIGQRILAQESLYSSLVEEAKSLSKARPVGYREKALGLLARAATLGTTNKEPRELRRVASACFGDFLGFFPITLEETETSQPTGVMALHPSGNLVALGRTGSISVRELPSGRHVAELRDIERIESLSFSKRGDELAVLQWPHGDWAQAVISTWTLDKDGAGRRRDYTEPYTRCCLPHQDGHVIIVWDPLDTRFHVTDLNNDQRLLSIPLEGRGLGITAISPDGRFLMVEIEAQEPQDRIAVDVWEIRTGKHQKRYLLEDSQRLCSIDYSPSGSLIAFPSSTGVEFYEDSTSRRRLVFKEHFTWPTRVAFWPSRTTVALPMIQLRRVILYDCMRGREIGTIDEPGETYQADFSSNGRYLVTAGRRHLRFFDTEISKERRTIITGGTAVSAIAFSPDGARLACVTKDRALKIYDFKAQTFTLGSSLSPGPSQMVSYSHDGSLLITTDYATTCAELWDADRGLKLASFNAGSSGMLWSAQFSPDGRFLATAGRGGMVGELDGLTLFRVTRNLSAIRRGQLDLERIQTYPGHWWSLQWSPDSRVVSVANRTSRDVRGLYLWDIASGIAPKRVWTNLLDSVQTQSFTPNARQLLFPDEKGRVISHDLNSGVSRSLFSVDQGSRPRSSGANNFVLSPDGERLAICSATGLGVEVWRPSDGEFLFCLPEGLGAVWGIAWAPDGRRLAVTRSDGDVDVWDVTAVEEVLADTGLAE
ncbi:MAG: protein kinase [Verrucomicrobiales bacterium]|nr:protein kinase [Verrucomicrobiales bacterium]